jgi:hypothetical protein
MVRLSLHLHRPIEELSRMESRMLATYVEELSDNGTE